MLRSDEQILKAYEKRKSVKGVIAETGFSWNKIVKSLSSNGVIVNENHRLILNLWKSGVGIEQIAKQVGVSVKTARSYLPRVRPVYGENRSKNAQRIKAWRDKRQE